MSISHERTFGGDVLSGCLDGLHGALMSDALGSFVNLSHRPAISASLSAVEARELARWLLDRADDLDPVHPGMRVPVRDWFTDACRELRDSFEGPGDMPVTVIVVCNGAPGRIPTITYVASRRGRGVDVR